MASRYQPLASFLENQPGERVPVTFRDVERALGFPLPRSKRYPAWWSNNPSNNPMTNVWLEAGFVTEQVDTARERLVFRRLRPPRSLGSAPRTPALETSRPGEALLARLRSSLGGTARYAPGYNLTEPTGEVWDAEQ